MRLPGLERRVRIEQRVGVFQSDDEADGDAIVGKAVDPAAAVHVHGNWPAQRVRHEAGWNAAGLHVPQFLDTDSIALRIQIVELLRRDEFFGERATRALGKHGDSGAQFIAGREIVFGLAIFVEAFVFSDDAGDSVSLINKFGTAKFLEDVDACSFHQPTKPFRDFAERNDVIAFVLKRRWSDWKTHRGSFCKQQCGGVCDARIERRRFLEIGN